MKLSKYFKAVAAKRLTAVETNAMRSNQHEFNGVQALKDILGVNRIELTGTFCYVSDIDEMIVEEGIPMTWYDSRENKPHRSAEFRLYYAENSVMNLAQENDLFVFSVRQNPDDIIVFVAPEKSSRSKQLEWIFGFKEVEGSFQYHKIIEEDKDLVLGARSILEDLGIVIDQEIEDDWLYRIREEFGDEFPTTKLFSEFAQATTPQIQEIELPDERLLAWLKHEEMLFRTLENHIVSQRIRIGFSGTDEFIQYGLTVHNKRKSRAGHSFENHLASIFKELKLNFSQGKTTENRSRPDFLFPGIEEYHSPNFSAERLRMLGAKTTCKDRWRQVLSEAEKIKKKHLVTLEPSISKSQTHEMKCNDLTLVVPLPVLSSYQENQLGEVISLKEFLGEVIELQRFRNRQS